MYDKKNTYYKAVVLRKCPLNGYFGVHLTRVFSARSYKMRSHNGHIVNSAGLGEQTKSYGTFMDFFSF